MFSPQNWKREANVPPQWLYEGDHGRQQGRNGAESRGGELADNSAATAELASGLVCRCRGRRGRSRQHGWPQRQSRSRLERCYRRRLRRCWSRAVSSRLAGFSGGLADDCTVASSKGRFEPARIYFLKWWGPASSEVQAVIPKPNRTPETSYGRSAAHPLQFR